MARGLVLGATLISVFSLIMTLIYTIIPMWLVLRIESDQQFCWWGEGIFLSRVYYGSYLDKIYTECEDPQGYGPLSTSEAYCSEHPVPPLNELDPPDYAESMCQSTNNAKITSVISVFSAFLTVLIGVVLHFTRLRRRYEYAMVVLATATSLLTIVLAVATLFIMFSSPLFSMAHNRALSKNHGSGIPFDGYSCSLTTPLRSIFTLLLPASLQCLFPGPSTLAPMLLVLSQSMATCFFFMLARQLVSASQRLPSHVHETLLSSSPLQRTTDLYTGLNSNHLLHEEEYILREAEERMFKELSGIRVYSLYGALARRTSSWSKAKQWWLITFVPFFLVLFHVLCWTGFILLGVQIIAGIQVKIALPKGTEFGMSDSSVSDLLMMESFNSSILPSDFASAMVDKIKLESNEINLWALEEGRNTGVQRKHYVLFEDVVNCFNFSPELSVGFFWNNGAEFIAVLSFLAMFILPIGKSMFWVWYWFAPGAEWWRGWILTFVDFSGKWMLAYNFIMAIMGAAMAFDLPLAFPAAALAPGLLPLNSLIVFEVKVGMTWSGMGGWLLMIACISSLFFGQLILYCHQKAVEWEEKRRESKDLSQIGRSPFPSDSTISSSSTSLQQQQQQHEGGAGQRLTSPLLSYPSVSSESPYLTMDTPLIRTTVHPTQQQPSGPRVLVNNNESSKPKSMMQAIHSFSNLQDLANNNVGGGNNNNENNNNNDGGIQQTTDARRPVLQAIARYGSTTLLNAEESEVALLMEGAPPSGGRRASRAIVHPTAKLSRAIHPEVEAMCDRVHQPMHGVRLRWTPFGKALIWFFLFLLAAMFILAQVLAVVEIEQTGVEMLLQPRFQELSIVTMTQRVLDSGWNGNKPYQAAALIFFTMSIMPLFRLLLVAYLWVLPLTVSQQKRMFSFLEFSEAWSSLEVFLVTVVGTKLEMPQLMSGLTGAMTPNISKIILFIFPFFKGLVSAKFNILPGFWFVFVAVIVEKLVSRLIMQQAATAIAERQAEKIFRNMAKAAASRGDRNLERIDENLSWEGVSSSNARRDMLLIGDATEGLLETDAAYFFSPAGRYTFAPQTLYGGLPRRLWTGLFVKWGLLGDADIVTSFGSPSSFSATTTNTPGGTGLVLDPDRAGNTRVNDGFVLEHEDSPPSPKAGGAENEQQQQTTHDFNANGENSPLMF